MSINSSLVNTDSGERLSFSKLFVEKEYEILIPIIQRDYAQGRNTNKNIRNDFINALKDYLKEGKPNRDLDFIYGSLFKDDNTTRFVPLDGQQRLTTLFLLHWYLSIKEKKIDSFREMFGKPQNGDHWKSKFTYETRTSATEFCDELVSANINIEDINPDDDDISSLSKIIKNQQWYFRSWRNDPTIQGMIVMLDALHELFKNEDSPFYELLIDSVNPIITFQFLKLEEFGLTDDLYIKMNARGKPLTSFENFKAKFEKYLQKPLFKTESYKLGKGKNEREVFLNEYFSHKIDTDWAKFFWSYTKDELKKNKKEQVSNDDIIMNFLRTYAVNFIAGKSNTEQHVRELIKTKSKDLNYNQFREHDCFDKRSVLDLITLLEIFQNGDKKARKILSNFYYYDEDIFEKFLKNDFNSAEYASRIKLHAFTKFLIYWKVYDENGFEVNLKKWMRIIHNLTENTAPYNSEKEFLKSIKGINKVIDNSNNINSYLAEKNSIDGFNDDQVFEEQIKACLIEKEKGWKTYIYEAEQHGYFKGQIGFLIRLSGITKYYNENENCDWSEQEDKAYKQNFDVYLKKGRAVFDDFGLKNSLSRDGKYIWERALLSIDDYLITEGQNKSFLIGKDRDISWKRFLKADKIESHHKIVRKVFETINPEDIVTSLNSLIDQHNNIEDWRKTFIETPVLFNYLGVKRYIRPYTNHGFVLFKGERMSGKHAELYSLKFFKVYLDNKPIEPFTESYYYEAKGAEVVDLPCVYMTGWSGMPYQIDVLFFDNQYEIWFVNTSLEPFTSNITELMSSLGMEKSEIYGYKAYMLKKDTDSAAFQSIQSICLELNKMNKNE